MSVSTTSGIDLVLKINAIAVGCAQNVDLDIITATSKATCRASGGWSESVPGQHSWKVGTNGLVRLATAGDVATNMTYKNLRALQIARTPVDVEFGTDIVGDDVATGTGIITSLKESSPIDGAATFSVEIEGTGPLTFPVNS